MAWIRSQIWQKYRILGKSSPRSPLHSPPPFSSPSPSSVNGNNYQKSSSGSRMSPAIIFILVILSVVVFVSGLLHFLLRFLIKHPSSSSVSQSNRYIEMSGSNAFQRQLQQLFHLHDSGLDQALIDTLPVFLYREIMGLIEPFDCAVCLCEFSEQDKLRLLPLCSHAFHVDCIDTWLLSNSSCPLCRGAIFIAGPGFENSVFCSDDTRAEDDFPGNERSVEEEITVEKRVFPVKLGKFKNSNNGGEVGETSGSNSSSLDARRCHSYSIGSYQYMVGNSNLQVALSLDRSGRREGVKLLKGRDGHIENPSLERDVDGKKFSGGSNGDSFSVSKIWLWSKKAKFSSSLDAYTQMGSPRSLQDGRPYEL